MENKQKNIDIIGCVFCEENHFPINLKGNFICIEETFRKKIIIDHCLLYDQNDDCYECESGYWL